MIKISKKITENKSSKHKKFIENYNFPSNYAIGDTVSFYIDNEWSAGLVVGVRFSTAKVFYYIVDDYTGSLFNDIDSKLVKEFDANIMSKRMFGIELPKNSIDQLEGI